MEVLPQPYHMPATPRPAHRAAGPVDPVRRRPLPVPVRLQRLEAVGETGAVLQHLTRRGFVALADRVFQPEGKRVDAALPGEVVQQGFVGDCRLRHPEAAEGT